jgi:ubiquinol-cytochrome c reductase cytochrome c subunit
MMQVSKCFLPFALVLALIDGVTIASFSAQDQTASGVQKPASAQAPVAPTGNAQKGQQLFTSYGCYECHGREGQGSTATGPRLAPRPLPFAALTRYVRQPSGQMPPYTTKVVSDTDLADIYAFLQSRPQPPAVDSIPLLKQ